MLAQQIVTNWLPSTTDWFNQPVTSTSNQVAVPSTTQSTLDLNLDVTNMVASMVNSNANYGFFLKLQNKAIITAASLSQAITQHIRQNILSRS